MKRKIALSLITLVTLVGAALKYTQTASSTSSNQIPRTLNHSSSLFLPFATTFTVDRTDDTAAATACTVAPNDCSLRGAIIASNADVSGMPITINLQPA